MSYDIPDFFSVKLYKQLLKILVSLEVSDKCDYVEILKQLTSFASTISGKCMRSQNCFDLLLFYIDLYERYVSDIIKLQKEEHIIVDISLAELSANIKAHLPDPCEHLLPRGHTLVLGMPTLETQFSTEFDQQCLRFLQTQKADWDPCWFVSSIRAVGTNKSRSVVNDREQIDLLVNAAPAKVGIGILEWANKFAESRIQTSCFPEKYGIFVPMFPQAEVVVRLIKMIFNESLDNLYTTMFYLAKLGNMDLTYIETHCEPGEIGVFLSKLKQYIASKSQDQSSSQHSNEDFVDDSHFDL